MPQFLLSLSEDTLHNQHHISNVDLMVAVHVGLSLVEIGKRVAQDVVHQHHDVSYAHLPVVVDIPQLELRQTEGELGLA